jgi:hypothetical protein
LEKDSQKDGWMATAAALVLVFGSANVLRARAARLQCHHHHHFALEQTMPSLVELWLRRFAASARAAHFVFSAGTLFGATTTWWGAGKTRRTPHEGVDFGRYAPLSGSAGGGAGALLAATAAVQPGCGVPCLCDGAVACVIRDFICETLVVEHPQLSQREGRAGMVLCSLYAHIRAQRRRGERVRAGERLCSVAPSPTSAPAHLHLSLAWLPRVLVSEQLTWKALVTDARVAFVDPLANVDSRLWTISDGGGGGDDGEGASGSGSA